MLFANCFVATCAAAADSHGRCPVRVAALCYNRYACDVWQTDGVSASMHQDHCRNHYFRSHSEINRHAVVPIGPIVDFNAAHGREEQFAGIAP